MSRSSPLYLLQTWLRLLALLALAACADPGAGPISESGDSGVDMLSPPSEAGDCIEEFIDEEGNCAYDDSLYDREDLENADDDDLLNVVDNDDIIEQESTFLTQEGDGKFTIYTNETTRIGVRAISRVGAPAEDVQVRFELLEDEESQPFGSVLSANQSFTNEFGVASVEIIAGPRPTFMYLYMEAEDTTTLTYQISVVQPPMPPDPLDLPPELRCFNAAGSYAIENHYEAARLISDGFFEALDFISRLLRDPGDVAADWIRDRIGGIVGDFVGGILREVVNTVVRGFLGGLPDWAQSIVRITEDVSTLLTDLQIDGVFEVGEADPEDECRWRGRHRWESVVLFWRQGCPPNGDPNCGRYELSLAELGLSVAESEFQGQHVNTIGGLLAESQIGQHSLRLNIGIVVLWFIQNVILPNRLGVNSFGELLARIIPCDQVGDFAASIVSIPFFSGAVDRIVERACNDGVRNLGNNLIERLAREIQVDVFDMAGECKFRNSDGMPGADEVFEGRWTQGFEGDFSGRRL